MIESINIINLFKSLLLTAIIYMIFPIIFFSINKNKYSKRTRKKIIIMNSIIIALILTILGYIFYPNDYYVNFAPAILYYGINYFLWARKASEKEMPETKIKKGKNVKKKIPSKIVIWTSSLNIILIITIIILSVIIYNKNIYIEKIKKDKDYYSQKYTISNNELKEVKNNLNLILNGKTLYYMQNKINFFDNNIVFVIDGYGYYYSNYDCMRQRTANTSFTYWAYNKEAAISKGYTEFKCN